MGAIRHPTETDAPVVVDPDAILPRTITFQLFQAIARRSEQILQIRSTVEQREFPFSHIADTGELSGGHPGKQALRLLIPKTSDHGPYFIMFYDLRKTDVLNLC
jgi:hypothetical protein